MRIGAPILSARVAQHVRESGGATCDEVEVALGLRHQTASARLRELVLKGAIKDSGARRLTRSKRKAAVYVFNDGPAPVVPTAPKVPLKKRTLYVVLNQDGMGSASFNRQDIFDYMDAATEDEELAVGSVEVEPSFCSRP